MRFSLRLPGRFPPGYVQRYVIPTMVMDVCVILLSYSFTYLVRNWTLDMAVNGAIIAFVLLITTLTLLTNYLIGAYHRIWSQTSGLSVGVLIRSSLITGALSLIVDIATREVGGALPYPLVILATVLSLGGMIAVRYRSRLISGAIWRWRVIWWRELPSDVMPERVLIVGAGLSGQDLAVDLRRMSQRYRMIVVGFVDDDLQKQGLYLEERPVLGTTEDIPRIVEEYDIQAIAVAIHNISGQSFRRILEICEGTHARIKVVPDIVKSMKQTHNMDLLRPVRPEDLIGRSVITTHKAVDLSPVEKRVVLITGAAGSIGSELSRQLPGRNPTCLILLDNNESGLHDLAQELQEQYPELKIVQALVDVSEYGELARVFQEHRPQIVFHAAAYKHVPMLERHPNSAVKANVGGTRNLADLSCEYKVERFVLVSTDKAVNPSSVMGASKRVCEMVVRNLAHQKNHDTLFAIVRFGNVLGSRGSVIPTFQRQIDRGGPITVTHPEMTRYFMSIAEAANLIIHAACLTGGGDTFLLRMGETVKILELAERMIRLRGMRPYVDIDIKFTGMRPGEKMHEQLYDGTVESARPTLHPGIIRLDTFVDSSDSAAFLAWLNRIIASGIDEKNALQELLYGLTPSEQFAIDYSREAEQSDPAHPASA